MMFWNQKRVIVSHLSGVFIIFSTAVHSWLTRFIFSLVEDGKKTKRSSGHHAPPPVGWMRRCLTIKVQCCLYVKGKACSKHRGAGDQITSRREQGVKRVIEAQIEERNADGAGGDSETERLTFLQGDMTIY